MGHAILERALLVGTRSADHIRASGHSGCIATGQASTRKTGRIHGCLRRKFLLQCRCNRTDNRSVLFVEDPIDPEPNVKAKVKTAQGHRSGRKGISV